MADEPQQPETDSSEVEPSSEPKPAPEVDPQLPAAAVEELSPKERRRRARAAKAAAVPARPERTDQQRQEDRAAERRRKAQTRRAGRVRARAKAREGGASGEQTPPREHQPGVQKTRRGIVVSDQAEKTITVRIDTARRHRRYAKIVRTSRTLHAHDERGDAHVGDTVIVRESRPLSRTKRWRLVEVVERAK